MMQAQTDVSGQFALNGFNGGDWLVEPQKVGDAGQAITAVDALSALRAAVGERSLDAEQSLACDMNGDHRVTAFDALLILQFRVGLIARFPVAANCNSDWVFTPVPAAISFQEVTSPTLSSGTCVGGSIGYHPLAGNAADQDFSAVLLGDCSGNWQPSPSGETSAFSISSQGAPLLRLGKPERRGRRFRVPLLVQSGSPVQAFDVDLQYDSAALSAPRVRTTPGAGAALVAVNDRTPGHLGIALASSQPLAAPRALVLEFDVQARHPRTASVRIVHATAGD